MGAPANFPTNFNSNVSLSAGSFGVTLVSVDPVFGIGHLLVQGGFLQIGDILLEVRFTPFFGNVDPPFFLPVITGATLGSLAGFSLFDSTGGILEVDIFDLSFGVSRTFSVTILFDFSLPVLVGPPNPSGLPGQWIIHI
jgi:hypothetical protein